MVVYLKCSNNNISNTVLKLFKSSVEKYGLPSRLHCDRGVENIEVGKYMLEMRDVNRGSLLVGSSVHNQRMETYTVCMCSTIILSTILSHRAY